jgi:hypothetical protein
MEIGDLVTLKSDDNFKMVVAAVLARTNEIKAVFINTSGKPDKCILPEKCFKIYIPPEPETITFNIETLNPEPETLNNKKDE